jgi:hypothetical protein
VVSLSLSLNPGKAELLTEPLLFLQNHKKRLIHDFASSLSLSLSLSLSHACMTIFSSTITPIFDTIKVLDCTTFFTKNQNGFVEIRINV